MSNHLANPPASQAEEEGRKLAAQRKMVDALKKAESAGQLGRVLSVYEEYVSLGISSEIMFLNKNGGDLMASMVSKQVAFDDLYAASDDLPGLRQRRSVVSGTSTTRRQKFENHLNTMMPYDLSSKWEMLYTDVRTKGKSPSSSLNRALKKTKWENMPLNKWTICPTSFGGAHVASAIFNPDSKFQQIEWPEHPQTDQGLDEKKDKHNRGKRAMWKLGGKDVAEQLSDLEESNAPLNSFHEWKTACDKFLDEFFKIVRTNLKDVDRGIEESKDNEKATEEMKRKFYNAMKAVFRSKISSMECNGSEGGELKPNKDPLVQRKVENMKSTGWIVEGTDAFSTAWGHIGEKKRGTYAASMSRPQITNIYAEKEPKVLVDIIRSGMAGIGTNRAFRPRDAAVVGPRQQNFRQAVSEYYIALFEWGEKQRAAATCKFSDTHRKFLMRQMLQKALELVAPEFAKESEMGKDEVAKQSVQDFLDGIKAQQTAEEVQSAKDSWKFDPQAYLYYQIAQVSQKRMEIKRLNPDDLKNVYLANVRPSYAINLFESTNRRRMLDITTAQAAHLVPRVRLFNVKRFVSGKTSETEIRFGSHMKSREVEDIFHGSRGQGAGLQEVEVQFQGTDLVSVEKLFGVKLRIYIQDIAKMTKGNVDSHLMKLIKYKVKTDTKSSEEIRLEIGWSVDDSNGVLFTPAQKREIESNKTSLFLGLKDHTFTINPDGTLQLDIEYVGRLENLMSSFDADIFPPTQEGQETIAKLVKKRQELESDKFDEQFQAGYKVVSDDGSGPTAQDVDTARHRARAANIKEVNRKKRENLRKKYKKIIDTLKDRRHVYEVSITEKEIDKFKNYCVIAQNSDEPMTRGHDDLSFKLHDSKSKKPEGKTRIVFFYLGDFIDVAVDLMRDDTGKSVSQERRKYEFFLGMVPTISPGLSVTGKEKQTLHNLAWMPITLSTYNEWFENNVNKKNKVYYPFFDFIKDVCNSLIFKVLGGNYFGQTEKMKPPVSKLSIGNVVVSSKSKIFTPTRVVTEAAMKKNLRPASMRSSGLKEVFFIYALPTLGSASYMKGNRKHDAQHGIYHLQVGRDKGVLKEINFAKANIPGWRESQTLKAAAQKDNVFATAPYNCDVKMLGNTMFKPGMTIFIDPLISGFGSVATPSSVAKKLQLGGYYVILGVTHYIKGQTFETSLRCVHNSMPNDTANYDKPIMVSMANVQRQETIDIAIDYGIQNIRVVR